MNRTILRLFLLCILCITGASAQIANNTSLVGTVFDASGGSVAGAQVTATEVATQVKYAATTNGSGYYAISFIKSGVYDISIEKTGFKKEVTVGVPVSIDVAVRTDFSLKIGSASEVVTVSASTPPLSTDDARLGETFETKQVEDLPVQGHNALEVAALASNVTIGSKTSYSGNPPGVDFIGAGQRETQNDLTLDGVSIMNNLGNVTPARPGTDMISEVQMQSGNYPAQYGAYLGVHINMVSKVGTNDFHGVAYDYIKNTALDAHNFLDSPTQKKAPLNYNQYGFTLGGPVYIPKLYNGKDKTFFFGSYEKLNQKAQTAGTSTVMTAAQEAGDFSALGSVNAAGVCSGICLKDPYTGAAYVNNQIPSNELSTSAAQIAKKYEAYIPLPNAAGISNNLNNVYFPNTLFIAQSLDRIDENIGEKVRVFARYHWQNLTYANGNQVPVAGGYGPANSRNLAFGYSHVITQRLVNDFHFGINTLMTDSLNYWYVNNLKGAGTSLGIPGFNFDTTTGNLGVPNVQLSSAAGMNIGNNGTNWFQDDRTVDGYDQVSYTRGKHNIMAGLELRKLTLGRAATNESLGLFTFNGTLTGDSRADFALGLAASDQTPVATVKGSVGEWRDGFFVLDNWQATQKLTINYGLRYDLPTVPYSLNGYARLLNPAETALIPATTALTANTFTPTPGFKLASPTHDNFGPRLGLAYRVTDKTVLRGGVGFYYNANQLNSFTLLSSNYPLGAFIGYSTTSANLLSLSNPTPGAGSASPVAGTPGTYQSAVQYDPANKTQRSYQWNVSVGQELWKGAAFELQYLGSHSLHLDISNYTNLPANPSANTVASYAAKPTLNSLRPNQLFGSIRDLDNIAYAHYNGLTTIFRQRLFHGISGQASYTWSHDLDIGSDSNGGGVLSQPYNIRADYGNANWDIRNRFVGVVTYELPKFANSTFAVREALGGWQLNDIVNLQSGMPFNVSLGYNSAGLDQGTERPNFVHTPSSHCSVKTYINGNVGSCIDISAYTLPVAPQTLNAAGATVAYNYAYGNSSRNTLHGPGFSYDNLSLFKNFAIREQMKIQFRAEAQNVFNHPSAGNPNATLSAASQSGTALSPANFGTVTTVQTIPGELSGSRAIQLAGKFIF
ncbi:TonB-dependent receptor [Granulicella arctica]|uniref:TonB-dependent receptor n=1 Tax=Granulicella arctica TaxID=940613 RepID=UPI0021DFEA0C|nr:carboxypeptidase regulatory-like domain-containing protein [Granulicella arctica]